MRHVSQPALIFTAQPEAQLPAQNDHLSRDALAVLIVRAALDLPGSRLCSTRRVCTHQDCFCASGSLREATHSEGVIIIRQDRRQRLHALTMCALLKGQCDDVSAGQGDEP